MKILRFLGLASMFMFLMTTSAVAGYGYGGYTSGSEEMTNPQEQMAAPEEMIPQEELGQVVFFTGELTALNDSGQEILVKSEVPGLLGPEEMIVPFRINDDTTVTVCVRSTEQCDSAAIGSEGWKILKDYENRSDFATAKKDVVIIGDPDSDRTVHVQVEYEL